MYILSQKNKNGKKVNWSICILGSMGRRDELKNYRNIGIMAHIDAGKVS